MKRFIQWEYKCMLFTDESTLSKLGLEGWEIACPAGKDGNYLVFKRPLDPEAAAAALGGGEETQKAAPTKKSYKEFI